MPDGIAVLQPDGSDVRGVVRFTERLNAFVAGGCDGVTIQYRITGLTDGEHGFHIHRYGDLTDGCTSACEHFDPQTQILESKIATWEQALGFLRDGRGGPKKNSRTGQIERVIYVGQYQYSADEIQERISKMSNQLSRRHHGGLDTKMRHFGDLGNITSSDGVAEGKLFLDKGRLNTSSYGILGRMIIVHADRDDLGKGGDEESLKTGNAGKRLACGVIGLADPNTDTMTMDAEDVLPRKCRECGTTENITTIQTGTFCFDCLPINLGAEEFSAEDNYDSTYGKEQAKIRRRLKNKLMGEATMGTKAGQWSARKSQELKRRYEAACERKGIKPYKGSKTTKQKDLSNWSKQGWRTASGRKSSVTGEPYFPAKAVKALKDKELYAKAKRQKAAATRAGKQRATYSKDIQAVVARYRAEGDDRSVPRNLDLIMSDPNADTSVLPSIDRIPVARSLDELKKIFRESRFAIIGFPLTTYRGVISDPPWMRQQDVGQRYDYLSTLDGGVIGGRCGAFAALGSQSNTPPVSLDLSVALDFAIGRKSGSGNTHFELKHLNNPIVYSIDLQDYLVHDIRLESDESSLGIPGGIHIDDAIPIMEFGEHLDIYASETIDDLDDESLMIRMENLAERMDAIVQRIGSYLDAERDPEYLRLVEQHTAYARVLARRHGFGAESDPVSSVAAGTTDALNDFANSQDTDDKFYFLGGLVGGLAIAVLGNIISDRLQDVYFPHWWDNRGGSKS